MKLFFTYGTLKKDDCRANVLKDSRYLGIACTTRDYKIFDCKNYPAVVEDHRRIEFYQGVWGELYEIEDDLAKTIDRIEGTPTLYKRSYFELSTVQLVALPRMSHTLEYINSKRALAYEYVNKDLLMKNYELIQSGLWEVK